MTRHPWASPAGPFGSEELRDVDGLDPDDAAVELEIARALERLAARDGGIPTAPFTDRVMTAIEHEPRPAPGAAAVAAMRQGRGGALLGSLVDAWRVTFGGGRPMVVRLQALALVGLLVVALAGATVGAASLLSGPAPSVPPAIPTDSPEAPRSPVPSPSPSRSETPSPIVTQAPSATPRGTDDETSEPTESDDDSGPGSGGDDDGGSSGSGSGSDDSGGD